MKKKTPPPSQFEIPGPVALMLIAALIALAIYATNGEGFNPKLDDQHQHQTLTPE